MENAADRVHTMGTAILGLTLECCRCHDHKYDPFTMRDYYSMFAFFNSIDENGMYDHTDKVPSPSLLLPTPEQAGAARSSARAKVAAAEAALVQTIEEAHRDSRNGLRRSAAREPGRPRRRRSISLQNQIAHFTFDGELPKSEK